ncbi:MAG: retroviral-like aspartic protease family protein, partial [Muribaculum sp.]|nr:retroviral-like aspartic protease family protein [Muribaculum sp.]
AGVMHEHNKKYKEAIEYYLKAMNKNAGSTIAERIANCYQDLGNFSEALAWTNRALNIDADDYDLVLLKADLLNDSGDVDGGIAELDKFIERYPEFYYGYYRRGFFKDNAQRIDEALEDYSFSIALNPEYAYAYFGRADMYKAKGDTQRANADYLKVIELDSIPGNNSCAQYAFFELGQSEKAVEFMDSIISHDRDNPGNYYEAACLYSRMGIKDKALGYLMTALEKGYNRFAHILVDDDLSLIRDTDTFRNLIKEYQTKRASENNSTESNEYVEEIVTVPFTKEGGVYKVKCSINELPLHFIFDTGASSVSLSMVEANFMMKNDYLKPSDIIGSQHFVDANGDISEGTIINLSHVNFGGLELSNVRASVVRNQKAPLLLGRSVLSRLGKIEIDNENQQLKITHKIKK